jgi:CIC family chloride channel protein
LWCCLQESQPNYAPIAGVLFAIEFLLVDVSISAFTPIMIAAATGALVSEIVLDETILLLNSDNNKSLITIKYLLYSLGNNWLHVRILYEDIFQRTELFFSQTIESIQKALAGASILAVLIFIFPTIW